MAYERITERMEEGMVINKKCRGICKDCIVACDEAINRLAELEDMIESGTSRIAAFYAGLDFVGCEIDKWYFDEQEKRFKERTEQMGLFE